MKTKIHIEDNLIIAEALASTNQFEITDLDQAEVIIASSSKNDRCLILGKDINLPMRLTNLMESIALKASQRVLRFKGLSLNLRSRELQMGQQSVELTEKESAILKCLMQSGATSKEYLSTEVWGHNPMTESNTLETHLSRLRGKLKQLDENQEIIYENGIFRLI